MASAAVLVAAVTFYSGCSSTSRYRILSFFFDGVPPPEGLAVEEVEQVTGPWGVTLDPDDPRARKTKARGPGRDQEEVPIVSYHAPYQDGRCYECHRAEGGYEAPAAGADACRVCHSSHLPTEPTDWVHGPVAAGECYFCHEAHESQHKVLLKGVEPELCLRCHAAADVFAATYHVDREQLCTTCHDPHLAGNRLLLADSRSYRRKTRSKVLPSPHASWDKEECNRCHSAEMSNVVIDNVDEVCRSCHDKVLVAATDMALHWPVRRGQCIVCHTPHSSWRPHLIRPAGETICLGCHEVDEIRTATHPRVARADCLLCHTGHASERRALLRQGIPSPGRNDHGAPQSSERSNAGPKRADQRARGTTGS